MKKSSGLFCSAFFLLLVVGCGKADSDGDGVPNGADLCPTVSAGRTPDPTRRGCPAPPALEAPVVLHADDDHDEDGIRNGGDWCPTVPAGPTPDTARPGCPALPAAPLPPPPDGIRPDGDGDSDGVPNADDWCPTVRAGETPDTARPGCPTVVLEDPDAGNAEADAGNAEADAGNAEADAGNAEADAGNAEADAGNAEADAGNAEAFQGRPVGLVIETAHGPEHGREQANAFCWVTSEDVRLANANLPNAPCARGVAGCWRRASATSILTLPQEGTRGTFACTPNSPLRWRCGTGVIPCNPVTAAATWQLQRQQRTRR